MNPILVVTYLATFCLYLLIMNILMSFFLRRSIVAVTGRRLLLMTELQVAGKGVQRDHVIFHVHPSPQHTFANPLLNLLFLPFNITFDSFFNVFQGHLRNYAINDCCCIINGFLIAYMTVARIHDELFYVALLRALIVLINPLNVNSLYTCIVTQATFALLSSSIHENYIIFAKFARTVPVADAIQHVHPIMHFWSAAISTPLMTSIIINYVFHFGRCIHWRTSLLLRYYVHLSICMWMWITQRLVTFFALFCINSLNDIIFRWCVIDFASRWRILTSAQRRIVCNWH